MVQTLTKYCSKVASTCTISGNLCIINSTMLIALAVFNKSTKARLCSISNNFIVRTRVSSKLEINIKKLWIDDYVLNNSPVNKYRSSVSLRLLLNFSGTNRYSYMMKWIFNVHDRFVIIFKSCGTVSNSYCFK